MDCYSAPDSVVAFKSLLRQMARVPRPGARPITFESEAFEYLFDQRDVDVRVREPAEFDCLGFIAERSRPGVRFHRRDVPTQSAT